MRVAIRIALLLSMLLLPACGEDPQPGAERSPPPAGGDAARPAHAGAIGSVTLADGRKVQVRWHRPRSNPGALPCLRVIGVDEKRRGCLRPPSEREPSSARPLEAWATAQRDETAPFEVYGTTSAETADVILIHRVRGERRKDAAHLIRADDERLLARAEIAAPFGVFFAELPPGADRIRARAYDENGELLGGDSFDRFEDLQPLVFIIGPWSDAEIEEMEAAAREASLDR